jgi:hypothetical protein
MALSAMRRNCFNWPRRSVFSSSRWSLERLKSSRAGIGEENHLRAYRQSAPPSLVLNPLQERIQRITAGLKP